MFNPFAQVVLQILPEPEASLLNGILFGIRQSLPPDLHQAMITTGTIHIIALSGQNISILTRLFSEISLPLGRKKSIITTILGIIAFVIFVGPDAPVVRAAIMGSLTLLSVYFGRQSWSLLSLLLAAGIMLIVNPQWLGEPSFQLSFMATLGIILLVSSPVTQGKTSFMQLIRNDFMANLKITLAAQLFTLPVIIFHFGRISLISPLTNVLIGWTITPIMVLGIFASLCGLVLYEAGLVVGWGVWILLSYIIIVVKWTALIPFAAIGF
ncbi:MAG: ComEC/Rec2 family competence protein [Patescibacteria group bacterium]